MDDWMLLDAWLRDRSQAAFAELVHRHVDRVFAVALRQVRNHHLAEDVTQAVFLILARKAPTMRRSTVIAGWLVNAAVLASRDACKRESRRRCRELAMALAGRDASDADLPQDQPDEQAALVQQAMAALPPLDRNAVILRFLEQKRLEEVGRDLGITANAARKRIGRALERMQRYCARRGLSVGALALAGLLPGQFAEAAPPGLADTIVRASFHSTIDPAIQSFIEGAIRMLRQQTLHRFTKATALAMTVVLALLALGGAGAWAARNWPSAGEAPSTRPAMTRALRSEEPVTAGDVVAGNNRFAFELYGRLSAKPGNIVLSPYSISQAMAMAYAGARGHTAVQIADTFHFSDNQRDFHPAFAEVSAAQVAPRKRQGPERPVEFELQLANGLWVDRGFPLLDAFVATLKTHYAAAAQAIDFSNPAEAQKQINAWTAEKTRGRIPQLLAPQRLPAGTALVLVNAAHFKAQWYVPFKPSSTVEEPFTTDAGQQVRIPMMHHQEVMNITEDEQVQVLELPYKNREASMLFVLPRRADGLADVEKALSAEKLQKWLESARERRVDISIPRFITRNSHSLAGDLAALGMPLAFDPDADFSGISRTPLHIGLVEHQAWINVDEHGTEAAAATQVEFLCIAQPAIFKADHPFLFVIRENATGSILFIGRIANPEPDTKP